MDSEVKKSDQPRSYFARKLAADPELAARCEAIAEELRKMALPEIRACERSEQLCSGDLQVYINVRA